MQLQWVHLKFLPVLLAVGCASTQWQSPYGTADPNSRPSFFVCESNLEIVRVTVESEDEYAVVLKLTTHGANEFRRFSAANVGHDVDIVVGDEIITRARVQTTIESGLITVHPGTRSNAFALRDKIEDAPILPCGREAGFGVLR